MKTKRCEAKAVRRVEPITQKDFDEYIGAVFREERAMTRRELIQKIIFMEIALLTATGTEIESPGGAPPSGERASRRNGQAERQVKEKAKL